MAERVLMIEDDEELSRMLGEYLAGLGYEIEARPRAREGVALLEREAFDALILDVMLPDLDGFEVCRRVRSFSNVPILMLTARGDEADRIVGLELGADDYLPKPFNPRELLARLRAVLRRSHAGSGGASPRRFGRLELDLAARVARIDGAVRPLTHHQFEILCALADHPGRVMSRDALMNCVRGVRLEAFDRSIDVHISRIRAAIEDDPKRPRRVITVRGAGYVFAERQDEDPRA